MVKGWRRRRLGGLLLLSCLLILPITSRGTTLEQINHRILTLTPLMIDPLNLPTAMDRDVLMIFLAVEQLPPLQPRYFKDGSPVPLSFYRDLKRDMALDRVSSSVPLTPALVIRPTLLRGLPTDEALFESPEQARSGEIDLNLYSLLPPGTPLALAHTTRDGRWAFALSTYNPGWVSTKDLVTTSWENLKGYVKHRPFVVVTAPHCPVFSSPLKGNTPVFTVPMGTRLPLTGVTMGFYRVLLPSPSSPRPWRTAYIPGRLAVRGYLPFNGETIVDQATNFLGEPYSWGGRKGVDCSLLVREVFATTGVILPRNSAQQGNIGEILWTPDSKETLYEALIEAPPGRTLLFLQGHVMIYLGRKDGEFKVIHSLHTWQGQEINGVVITPLDPFKDRVIRAVIVP